MASNTRSEAAVTDAIRQLEADLRITYDTLFGDRAVGATVDSQFYYDSYDNPSRNLEISLGVDGHAFPIKVRFSIGRISQDEENIDGWEACWKVYEPYGKFGQTAKTEISDCEFKKTKSAAINMAVKKYAEFLEMRDKFAAEAKKLG